MVGTKGRHRIFLTNSSIAKDGNLVIYGQYCKDEDVINRLMENIKASSDSFQKLRDIALGETCLALFAEDGLWYRGLVNGKSENNYEIEFIDYANIQQTSIQDLREMPENFGNLEPQAHCFLLDPQGGPVNPAGVFTTAVSDVINDEYLYTEVEIDVTQTTLQSVIASSDSITQTLVDKGVIDVNKPYKHLMESEKSSLGQEKYTVGQKINTVLSCVEPDGSFYCYNTENEHLLNEQMDELYEFCEGHKLQVLAEPAVGKLCCAPYSADGNWYRAEIITKRTDKAVVRFVDYGNTDTCDLSSLLPLGKLFRNMPVQAICCSLFGSHEKEKLARILNSYKDKEIIMEFMNLTVSPYAVRLYDGEVVIGLSRGSSPPCNVKQTADPAESRNLASYKQVSISLGSSKQVILKVASNVKSIWCVLAENMQDLEKVHEETNEVYNRISNGDYNFEPDQCGPNQPCVVFDMHDKRWYRSKLLSRAGPSQYKVLYVDFGRIQIVNLEAIRIISDGLLKLPAFAIRFTLTAVLSASGNFLPLEQCLPFMTSLEGKSFVAVFNNHDQEKELYFAEIHDVGHHISLSPSRVKSAILKPKVVLNLELPIRITSVDDPDCVWVQLIDYQADLIMLTGKLNAYYNALPHQALALKDVHRGQVCCMKSCKTKNWCRGEVAYFYDEIVEVKFIDFGYIEATRMSDAKVLMPEFMLLPSQAICCRSHNLKPAASQWCNGGVRFLKEFVTKSGVTARFVEKTGSVYSTEMFVASKEERILLGEKLVNEGLAAWIDPKAPRMDINPEPTKTILDGQPILQKASLPGPRVFYSHPGIGLIGAEIPAIVCDSPSPSDFFILPCSSGLQRTYDKMARELKIYLGAEPANFAEIYVGMPCVCIIGRECYRAAVVSEEKTANPLVFLVDFGEKKRIKLSELRNITAEHIKCVPPIAIRCTLHGFVEPKNQFWPSNAMLTFSKFCKEATRDLICTIYGCITDGMSQFFMANLATPFQDISKELVASANCRFVSPIGKMPPPFSLKSFIYSNLGAGIGKDDHFYITHIERADLFYCQLASKFHLIDDFMDKVQEYCSNFKPTKLLTPKELAYSPPCFAKYDDEKWYRAHYTTPQTQSLKHVNVIFVDYGNLVTVPLTNVIPFHYKSGLAEVPIQAIPCSLSELVAPIPDLQKSESILSEMRSKLLHRQLPGSVTGCTNGKFHLDLFVDKRRVNDQITGNVSPVNLTTPDADSNEIDNDPLLKAKFTEIENINPKTVHSVYISEITDPDHFHVRLESLEDDFNECTAEVDGYYTAIRRQDYVVRSLQNKDIVCAKHPATLRWCRALVVDAESHKPTHALVEFVDYGDQEYVSVEDDTKKLIKSMLQWPRMTIRCQIANIVPLGNSWEPRNMEYFINTCRAMHCRVRFNTFDVAQRVWAIDMKIEGKNVARMMVEKSNAKFVNTKSSTMSSNTELFVKTRPIDSWEPGVTKQVFISHVESVSEVYLQLVEYEASLNVMMTKLNDPTLNLKAAVKVDRQQSYASKYEEDDRYYRSNIVTSDSNIHRIIYTDYGNSSFVKIADLRLLPKEFTNLTEQAVKCSVACPPGLNKDLIVAKLEDIAADQSVSVHAKCVNVEAGSSSLHVELYIQGEDGDKTRFVDLFGSVPEKMDDHGQEKDHAKRSPKDLHLRTGIDTKVYVSQVDEPEKIWIQLSEYSAKLDSLMAEIDAFCNGDAAQKLKVFDSGTPCLAKYYDDNGWYRGEIMHMDISKNEAQVHLFDYGNCDSVKIADMRETNDGFLQLPKQAIRCKLFNLQGIQKWKSLDTENFVERVSDVELTAQFYPCKSFPELHEVKLTYPCGKSLNDEWNETLRNRSQTTIDANGSGDTISVDQSTASSSVPEQHIVTDRGDHVIVENLIPPPASSDFNTSMDVRSTPTLKSDATLQKLSTQPGVIEDGYVSHCDNPGCFFIQLAKHASELDKMYELLAKSTENPLKRTVEAGRYYVAKSPDDGEWYRAKCTEFKDGKYIVSFIDYGNTAQVEESDLKPMRGDLKTFAMQAIECQIHNLIPKDGCWGDTTDFFLEMVLDKDLKIEFVELAESGRWNVKLIVDDIDVRKQIVEKHRDSFCLEQRESKINLQHFPQSFAQTGSILCVNIVKVMQDTIIAILLNIPSSLLQDAIEGFVANLEGGLQKRLLAAHDLDVSSVYLRKTSEWHCVKVINTEGSTLEGIDFSTKEIVKLNDESLFLRPDAEITSLANSMLAECYLEEKSNVGLKGSIRSGEIVAVEILSRNDQGKWKVKILPLGQSFDKNAVTTEVVLESPIPEVLVTNADETGERMSEKRWTCERIRELLHFFSRGIQLFKNCPETLVHLRSVLLESRSQILSDLPEHEKKLFKSDVEYTVNGERLKRFSTDLEEQHHSKELPAKKIKLDFHNDDTCSAHQLSAGMFDIGDKFEAIISTIDNPGKFFIRPFLVMAEPVKTPEPLCKDTKKHSKRILPNVYCIAKCAILPSNVHHWVRAVVEDYDGEDVLLTDIDTGAEFETKAKNIYPVGEAVKSWPSFCLECSLIGIKPHEYAGSSTEWSDSATDELKSLVGDVGVSDCVEIHVVSITYDTKTKREKFGVGIKINEMSVSDTLVSLQVADSVDANFEKENMTQTPNVITGVDRGGVRKPLSDLMPDMHFRRHSIVITPRPSESVGQSVPDFDLLAIPWKIIRTSFQGSETASLSDSVFVSDTEDSLAGQSGQPIFAGKKHLTSFKIYCSIKSPVVRDDMTFGADAIEESLSNEEGEVESCALQEKDLLSSDSSSLLELLTPVTGGSSDTDKEPLIVPGQESTSMGGNFAPLSCDAREKLLDGAANVLVGEVFHSIEIEDGQEEVENVVVEEAARCTIPDSLDDASIQLLGAFQTESISNQGHVEDLLVEHGAAAAACTIPDSLDDASIRLLKDFRTDCISNQGHVEDLLGEHGTTCTIPDSLDDMSIQPLKVFQADSITNQGHVEDFLGERGATCTIPDSLNDTSIQPLKVFQSNSITNQGHVEDLPGEHGAACTIPDPLDDTSIQPLKVFQADSITDQGNVEDLLEEHGAACTIPDSLDDMSIQPLKVFQADSITDQGNVEDLPGEHGAACTIPDPLDDTSIQPLKAFQADSITITNQGNFEDFLVEHGAACTIPDSPDDTSIQPIKAFQPDSITNQGHVEDFLVENGVACTIPDSVDDANLESQKNARIDSTMNQLDDLHAPEEEDAVVCTIPDSLSETPDHGELVVEFPSFVQIEKEIVVSPGGDNMPIQEEVVIESVECLNLLPIFQECVVEDSFEHLTFDDDTDKGRAATGEGEILSTEKLNLCEIPHPDSTKSLASGDHEEPRTTEQLNHSAGDNADLLEISQPNSQNTDHPEFEQNRVQSEKAKQSLSKEELKLCDSPNPDGFPFVLDTAAATDDDRLPVDGDDAEGNLKDILVSSRVSRSIDDVDYFSAEESLVKIPLSEGEKETEQSVFPQLPIDAVNSAIKALHGECLPECDQYETCPLLSLEACKPDEGNTKRKQDVDGDLTEESCSYAEDEVENRQAGDQQQGGKKEMKTDHSGLTVVLQKIEEECSSHSRSSAESFIDEEEEIVHRLRNMSIVDSAPQQEESVAKEESTETERPDVTGEKDVLDNQNIEGLILADQPLDQRASTEVCSHQHKRLYICCLPKMQLEVGDSYQVLYMNSKDPHNIQLQFDFGTDTEEWRKALGNVNTQESVDKFDANEVWEPDMMCLVQCLADMSWERGRIISKKDDNTCEVDLIDHGEVMKASIQQLREIPENLCLYPRQSARCSLFVVPGMKELSAGGRWDENINQHLIDLLFCSSLRAEIVEICESPTEENYVVKLFLVQDDGQTNNIGKMLIDAGLAQSRNPSNEENTKPEDDEWSTMTDSAWESLLHHDVSRSDLMHSSNVDLSNVVEAFNEEAIADAEIRESQDVSGNRRCDKEAVKPSEEELQAVAREIQTQVTAGAVIIAGFGNDDPLAKKDPTTKTRKKSKDVYIDLENIPRILVKGYESTEIN